MSEFFFNTSGIITQLLNKRERIKKELLTQTHVR